jgi:hypothetical protein
MASRIALPLVPKVTILAPSGTLRHLALFLLGTRIEWVVGSADRGNEVGRNEASNERADRDPTITWVGRAGRCPRLAAGETVVRDNAQRLTSCLVGATEERP